MGDIAIVPGDGTVKFVPATLVVGGLALTKLFSDLWSVTHVATGARIGPPFEQDCPEQDAFNRLVALLKSGADWTQPGHMLRADLATVNRARSALGFFPLDKVPPKQRQANKHLRECAAMVADAYRSVPAPPRPRP